MKRLLLSIAALLALTGGILVAADKPADKAPSVPATKPVGPATKPAVPINKFCAIDRDNPVDLTVPTVTYNDKVIGFCCDDCVPKFKKNPELYMKDLK